MRIAVVIVNWNGADLLVECLQSLAAQERSPDRVIIVDNGSTDGSLDRALHQFPSVETIRLAANRGFAVANNVALRACADCDWVALLNPDAFPAPSWLWALASAAEQNPGCAAFASQLRSVTNELLDGAGDVYHVSGLSWRAGHGSPTSPRESRRDVFSACAAAALYRRDALMEIRGFDERYFCYHEDVDLGFRLRLRGHGCLYVPDAVVRHVGSASSGKGGEFSIYHGHRNLVWTFFKDMPTVLLAAYLPQHLLLNVMSVLWFSARGRAPAILRAKRDAVRGLPAILAERRAVQRARRIDAGEVRRTMARGWLTPYTSSGRGGHMAAVQATA